MVGANVCRPSSKAETERKTNSKPKRRKHEKGRGESSRRERIFAFVNKNAATIGTRTKEETVMVHSHVAKNAARKQPPTTKSPGSTYDIKVVWDKQDGETDSNESRRHPKPK
jgi:hypothetical protein